MGRRLTGCGEHCLLKAARLEVPHQVASDTVETAWPWTEIPFLKQRTSNHCGTCFYCKLGPLIIRLNVQMFDIKQYGQIHRG